jgi:hypothetical protein
MRISLCGHSLCNLGRVAVAFAVITRLPLRANILNPDGCREADNGRILSIFEQHRQSRPRPARPLESEQFTYGKSPVMDAAKAADDSRHKLISASDVKGFGADGPP